MDLKRLQELAGNRPKSPKIRWWDYIVVFFYADFMTAWLFVGFTATEWYWPIIAGGAVGFLWRSWTDWYCQWRLRYEQRNQ